MGWVTPQRNHDYLVITLEIDLLANQRLTVYKDNLRADISVAFIFGSTKLRQMYARSKAVGVERASNRAVGRKLFNAKFAEALKTVGKQMNFSGTV